MANDNRTIQGFSQTRKGLEFLSKHFLFDGFPCPELLEPIPADKCNPSILGTAAEQVILLIVKRQSPNLKLPDNWLHFLPGRRNAQNKKKDAGAIQDYLRDGELTDNLLDYLICLGERRSRSCSLIRTAIRQQSAHRDALRKIHDAAARLEWKANHLAHSGRLARMFVAQADLILDHALIEIKAVQSGCHHERHLGQLFAYYLVSQAPVERVHPFEIKQLAIYYARHGTLIKHSVSKLIRFPIEDVKLIAFNFLVECELQRFGGDQKWRNDCFNRLLRAVNPRPSWLREALDREQRRVAARWKSNLHDSRVRRINVPDGFLVEGVRARLQLPISPKRKAS